MITLGDCFSGIGGNSLGFKNVFDKDNEILWGSELNDSKYGKYLESLSIKHFPKKKNLGDITNIFELETTTIIDGGFPCQDISQVNTSGGSGTSGIKSNLYTHQLRLSKLSKSEYIHFENSWMISKKGLNNVLFDLFKLGYNVQWRTLPLYVFGLPHGRMRTYIVAYKKDTMKSIFDTPENFIKRYGYKLNLYLSPKDMTFTNFEGNQVTKDLLVESTPEINFRLNALGNSVNTIASTYVHDAIKRHMNNITSDIEVEFFGNINLLHNENYKYEDIPLCGIMNNGEVFKTPDQTYTKPEFTIPTPVKTQSIGWEDAFCWTKYNSKDRIHIGKKSKKKIRNTNENKPSLISQDPTLLFKKWYLTNMNISEIENIDEFNKKIKPNLPKLSVNPNLVELMMGFPIDWTKL